MHPITTSLVALNMSFVGAFVAPVFAADDNVIETVRSVEARVGGRIGIAVRDTGSGKSWEHRATERFPISSTFKPFACAAILSRIEKGEERLHRTIDIVKDELVSYSPATEKRVNTVGMTLAELCDATITLSDNTAGNLILQSIGGPTGFTDFMHSIGDRTTRLDRWETALNEGTPGDPRDTTTPNAATRTLHTLLLTEVLSLSSREQLSEWMEGNKVGDALFRSVLPADWRIADKTGAGGYGARSLIAVLWPPSGAPIIASVYMAENEASFADRNAAIAEIGAAIVKAVSQ